MVTFTCSSRTMLPRSWRARSVSSAMVIAYRALLFPACDECAVADVATVLHALEANRLGDRIGAPLRGAQVPAQCRNGQHPPARGHDILSVQRRSGVEHVAILLRRRQAVNRVTLARGIRVAVRGKH